MNSNFTVGDGVIPMAVDSTIAQRGNLRRHSSENVCLHILKCSVHNPLVQLIAEQNKL